MFKHTWNTTNRITIQWHPKEHQFHFKFTIRLCTWQVQVHTYIRVGFRSLLMICDLNRFYLHCLWIFSNRFLWDRSIYNCLYTIIILDDIRNCTRIFFFILLCLIFFFSYFYYYNTSGELCDLIFEGPIWIIKIIFNLSVPRNFIDI